MIDQACGTGGMLSTAYTYLKHFNPTADVRLFGQEFMGPSYAVGLAEMLIKGQNAENFRHTDTLKNDCFPDIKMRFLLENPPFGTSWSGESAKAGQEDAVKAEHNKGLSGRWGAGLPAGNDAQLIFMQSAVHKMDDNLGRAAIISNGSPLFAGNTASGESQIRRWLLENDLIEAIIQLPTESFYNTPIVTYIWLLSKNKRPERKGKIQLIDASAICHKLRKPLGNKKNEFLPEDRAIITKLYADFADADVVQIYDNTEFLYKEYTVMQPLQRSYSITEDSIANMLQTGTLRGLYDGVKVAELEDKGVSISGKEQTKLDGFRKNKPVYDAVLEALKNAISTTKYLSVNDFMPVLNDVLEGTGIDAKLIAKIADGLSVMDKEAEIQRETKGKNRGEIIYDKTTKDTEIIKWDEDIDDYMAKEVLPYVPDAKWFWEENLTAKKPTIKTGAEIPFTRYFSKYQEPTKTGVHLAKFNELEKILEEKITNFNNSLSIAITGLNSDVKMKESGVDWVGSIPEHWRFEKGKYHFTNNKFIPGVDSCKYQRLSLTLNGVLPRSKDDADGLQPKDFDTYQLLKKGELVFKLIDLQNVSTSRIGLAHDTGLVSPAYIVLHAKEDVLPEYIQYFYLMMWHREIFNALGDNGVRSSLSASDLLNVRIPIPPMDEQIAIANYLYEKNKEIDEILSLMQTQLAELIKYKKAFIGMNVTGKKEVPENV